MQYVYVLNKNGEPLMPTSKFGMVRHALKEGRAKVVNYKPFTIQLTYETTNYTQPLILGIDPGRTNIGMSVINQQGNCVMSTQVETRNKDIPKLMQARKAFRQAHRRFGRRKIRQRRACATDPSLKTKIIERHLPGYGKDEFVTCKHIKNKQAKFNNRKRPDGWLTPTANQLLQTHVNMVKKLMKLLPITDIVVEVNKFSFMKLEDPDIKPWQYSKGSLYGYSSVEDKLYDMQDGLCLICGKTKIEHYHHIVPKKLGGSDTIDNMAGVCFCCHDKVHKDDKYVAKLKSKKTGLYKKYGALSVLNQIMPRLLIDLSNLLGKKVIITDGRTTKAFRTTYSVPKDHYLDAYCIACSGLEDEPIYIDRNVVPFRIKQFRRHNRQACYKAMLNRNYYLNGELVATNRHKAIEQKTPSLEEFRAVHSKRLISKLVTKPHKPVYTNMSRIYPGATFYDKELKSRFILTANRQHAYFDGENKKHKTSNSVLLKANTGLVFI